MMTASSPCAGHPGREHCGGRPCRGRRTALEPVARAGSQRPGTRRRSSTAELAGDTTAAARAGHATALAARPEPAVKAAAWDAAVHGTGLSNQLLSATIAGFATGPAALLEPYIEPYFECLEQVWAERSIEIAGRIVRGLYPAGAGPGAGRRSRARPGPHRTGTPSSSGRTAGWQSTPMRRGLCAGSSSSSGATCCGP